MKKEFSIVTCMSFPSIPKTYPSFLEIPCSFFLSATSPYPGRTTLDTIWRHLIGLAKLAQSHICLLAAAHTIWRRALKNIWNLLANRVSPSNLEINRLSLQAKHNKRTPPSVEAGWIAIMFLEHAGHSLFVPFTHNAL